MKHRRHLITALLSFAAALLLHAGAAEALTISPPTYDFTVNPGDTIKGIIRVTNEGDFPETVTPELSNFTYKEGDEVQGIPEFYPPTEDRDGHGLAAWISVDRKTIVIAPKEKYNLEFSFTVPKDGQPGGHFGAIHLVNSSQAGTETGVGLKSATTALILVRVEGDVNEDLSLSRFSGDQATYTHLPVDFHTRLENKGNTLLRPVGDIFIRSMFGRTVADIHFNDAPPGGFPRAILPSSARRFDDSWFRRKLDDSASEFAKEWSNFAFGRYKASLVLNYGENNRILTGEYDFWVIPWMVLLVLLGGGAALLVVLGLGLKAYNNALIKKYEAMKAKKG